MAPIVDCDVYFCWNDMVRMLNILANRILRLSFVQTNNFRISVPWRCWGCDLPDPLIWCILSTDFTHYDNDVTTYAAVYDALHRKYICFREVSYDFHRRRLYDITVCIINRHLNISENIYISFQSSPISVVVTFKRPRWNYINLNITRWGATDMYLYQ